MSLDVERLVARVAATPAAFFRPVEPHKPDSVSLPAVVGDLFRERASRAAWPRELAAFTLADGLKGAPRKEARRYLGVVLIASYLLHDTAFAGIDGDKLARLFAARLRLLAPLVMPRAFVEDPDRREELVRVCLHALGLAPAGEKTADAEDRLATLDSVRRVELLSAARAREQTREAERKKKLEELKRREEEERLQAARTTYED